MHYHKIKMKKHEITGEAMRFVLVGVLATMLHYGLYLLMQGWMQVDVAYTLAYVLSFVANFYLTSWFTFHAAPSWSNLVGMGGAHAVNYLLHIALLNLFLWLGIPKVYAPLPVLSIAVPINFLLVRFVFKKK